MFAEHCVTHWEEEQHLLVFNAISMELLCRGYNEVAKKEKNNAHKAHQTKNLVSPDRLTANHRK